jgi:hypothetical protein
MGEAIVSLLPMMVSAALVPAPVIVVVLLLRGPHGLGAATAFVGGMTTVRLMQGALFGAVFADAMDSGGKERSGTIAAVLLLVLGILLWITAIRQFLKEEDPDELPPKWLGTLQSAPPLMAFGIGAGLVTIAAKQWVFTLSALGVLGESSLGINEAVIAYLIFVLGAELLILLPVVASAVAPAQAAVLLERIATWLMGNTRGIKIAVSVIFGTYFLWKGISGLLA